MSLVTEAPEPPATARVPWATLRVTRMALPSSLASSATEIRLPLAALNTRAVSSLVPCAPGTVLTGASLTALTVITALSVPPPSPPSLAAVAAWTSKPKAYPAPLLRSAAGVNFSPAPPSATVMKSPLLITVVPSLRNRAPLAMLVILKKATSAPSAALRVITRPEVLCTSSLVVASVTDGVSGSGVTVMARSSASVSAPPSPALPRSSVAMERVAAPK